MVLLLNAAWALYSVLKFAGLAIAIIGVAIFGWYFVRANARAARNADKNASIAWGGAGATVGLKVIAFGLAMQVTGFLLALVLPSRM